MQTPIRRLTINAMLLAILIICSQVTIPLPLVPLTLQTLAVGLIASLVSLSASLEIIGIYIILGMVGLPVFAGMSGGIVVVFGPLGGYIFGFLLYVLITAGILAKVKNNLFNLTWANILGAFFQLLVGSVWLMYFSHLTLPTALMTGFVPFVIAGIIKVILVAVIAVRIKQAIKL